VISFCFRRFRPFGRRFLQGVYALGQFLLHPQWENHILQVFSGLQSIKHAAERRAPSSHILKLLQRDEIQIVDVVREKAALKAEFSTRAPVA
jgi:hypothetical protein